MNFLFLSVVCLLFDQLDTVLELKIYCTYNARYIYIWDSKKKCQTLV